MMLLFFVGAVTSKRTKVASIPGVVLESNQATKTGPRPELNGEITIKEIYPMHYEEIVSSTVPIYYEPKEGSLTGLNLPSGTSVIKVLANGTIFSGNWKKINYYTGDMNYPRIGYIELKHFANISRGNLIAERMTFYQSGNFRGYENREYIQHVLKYSGYPDNSYKYWQEMFNSKSTNLNDIENGDLVYIRDKYDVERICVGKNSLGRPVVAEIYGDPPIFKETTLDKPPAVVFSTETSKL